MSIAGDATHGLTALTDDGHVLRFVGGAWVRDRPLPMRLGAATLDQDGHLWVNAGPRLLVRR